MNKSQQTGFLTTVEYDDGPNLVATLRSRLMDNWVVHLNRVPHEIDLLTFYTKLTDNLGRIIMADEGADGERNFQRWTNVEFIKEQQHTFRHSATRQPLHTDNAYISFEQNVVFFYCVRPAPVGGATTFIDGQNVVGLLETYEPKLFDELSLREVVFGKGESGQRVRKIIEYDERGISLNWNYFRVDRANNRAATIEMCERFHQFCEHKLVEGGLLTPIKLEAGECVIFHDERVLHGRNSFFGDRCPMKGGIQFE